MNVKRCCAAAVVISMVALLAGPGVVGQSRAQGSSQAGCTFTARVNVNLRGGPGTENRVVGRLRAGESVGVTGQQAGADGYVWWQAGEAWLRADLGESDCAPVCGDRECEGGETSGTCLVDCPRASGSGSSSTSGGCVVRNCQECYDTISCYPACSQCTCSENQYGCTTCQCTYPGGSSTNASTSTASSASGCVYSSCEACIADNPCWPTACTTNTCSLNENGCPVCTTAP